MKDHYEEITRLGAQVLAVVMAPPANVAMFLEENPLPFSLVADPQRRAYQLFGLRRTSWFNLMRPEVIWGYLKLMFRGWMPRKPGKGEDLLQLGGDFILDANLHVVFGYQSKNPTHRPDIKDLLQVLGRR